MEHHAFGPTDALEVSACEVDKPIHENGCLRVDITKSGLQFPENHSVVVAVKWHVYSLPLLALTIDLHVEYVNTHDERLLV